MTLRQKLSLFVGLPVVALFALLVGTEYMALRSVASNSARDHAQLLAERTAQDLNAELAGAAAAADVMAAAMSEGDLDVVKLPSIGADMVSRLPLVDGVVFGFQVDHAVPGIPVAGYTFVRDGHLVFEDIAERFDITQASPWYLPQLVQGEGVWTEPFQGEVFGGPLVSYTTPFVMPSGARGFVVVDIPLAPLVEQLHVGEYDHVETTLLSAEGRTIVAPQNDLPQGTEGGHVVERAFVPETNWTFIAAIRDSEVFANVDRLLWRNAAIMIGGAVAILLLLVVTALSITRRIACVSRGVQAVAGGDLDARVHPLGGDEIGRLAAGFNDMTTKLRRTVQQVADAAARRQAVERELAVAREIQQAMLPTDMPPFPDRPEVDMHAQLEPTSAVAGDFYDWWLVGDELTVVIADVSGHGVPAALVMSQARTLLRDAHGAGASLTQLFDRVNAVLADHNERQMFLTGIVVQLQLATGRYRLVNGGHPQALIVRPDVTAPEGMPTGPLLGVMSDAHWEIRSGTLDAGAAIVLYTDGITEACNARGMLLGTDALAAALTTGTAEQLCARAVATAKGFQDGPLSDDLTVVALRWVGSAVCLEDDCA